MRDETFLRQVTLVSYGTQFLCGKLPLNGWYHHSIFHKTRFQFRSADDNRLLADDFTLWLAALRNAGAQRLSLHTDNEFPAMARHFGRKVNCVVAVHHADHYELWTGGD